MAITLSVSNGKLVSDVDFYSPSGGIVELTLSAGAFINQYSPVEHDVTVYQWQYDSEKVELDYGSVTMSGNSGSFELKFGCEFFVIGLKVGKHETIQTVPIHVGSGANGLPVPTASDLGKVLTVVESSGGPKRGTTIAEEQTVTIPAGEVAGSATVVHPEEFIVGQTYALVVDGTTYTAVCEAGAGNPARSSLISAGGYTFSHYGDAWSFAAHSEDVAESDETYTIEVYAIEFETGEAIVPEQTVTVRAYGTGAELENVDESLFVAGTHVIMEVNGTQCEGTVIMEDEVHPGVHVTIDGENYAILLYGTSWVFSCPAVNADTEFTVALYEAAPVEVEYGLETPDGPLVIHMDYINYEFVFDKTLVQMVDAFRAGKDMRVAPPVDEESTYGDFYTLSRVNIESFSEDVEFFFSHMESDASSILLRVLILSGNLSSPEAITVDEKTASVSFS